MDGVRNVRPIAGGMTGAVVALDASARNTHRLVLKLYRPDPSEPDSAGREARILELLTPTDLPVPRVVATDREGSGTVWPALLMTRMPGRRRFRPREVGPWLEGMARLAARIHSAPVPPEALPAYRLWGADDPLLLPDWWSKPAVWKVAVEVFRGQAPDEPATFIHRDFHPGNVLWKGRRPSGIVRCMDVADRWRSTWPTAASTCGWTSAGMSRMRGWSWSDARTIRTGISRTR